MRKLVCLLLLPLVLGAAPPVKKQGPIYLEPVKFQKVTFKDKTEGFAIVWEIHKKDFDNKIVPEMLTIRFHGPQPITVRAREYVHATAGWWLFMTSDPSGTRRSGGTTRSRWSVSTSVPMTSV